jgi:DNA-binding MarR family transcriptional regulator
MRDMSTSRGRKEEIDEADVFFAIKQCPDPFVGTTELAEALGVSSPTVRKRLCGLQKEGLVKKKGVGSGDGWWIPQDVSASAIS